jgi:hypothetical protein
VSQNHKVFIVSAEDLREGVNGICLSCGEIQDGGVEPDARDYPCEACGGESVCGLEEALLMGRVSVSDYD